MKKKFQKAFNMIASLLACVNLTSPIQAKDTNCSTSNSVSVDNSTKRSKRKNPYPIYYSDQSFIGGVADKILGRKPELVRLKEENFEAIKNKLVDEENPANSKIRLVPYDKNEKIKGAEYVDLVLTKKDAELIRKTLEEILNSREKRRIERQSKISN